MSNIRNPRPSCRRPRSNISTPCSRGRRSRCRRAPRADPGFANLPTDKVGDALRKLAASWDGQDRWYLEALGLALDQRESEYLFKLFDGTLYGELDLDRAGKESNVALPPYFPVDRNEAYIETGTPDLPGQCAQQVSRAGVASSSARGDAGARAHHPLSAGSRAATGGRRHPRANERARDGRACGGDGNKDHRPGSSARAVALLARRLAGAWNSARVRPHVLQLIQTALANPETRQQGIALAAATATGVTAGRSRALPRTPRLAEEVRVAAVEAIGSFRITPNRVLEQLVSSVRGKPSSNSVAEAAVRAMAQHSARAGSHHRAVDLRDYPLGLRREALRSLRSFRTAVRR